MTSRCRGFFQTVVLAALAGPCICLLAVDPPPPSILREPPDQQLEYTRRAGAESERLRAKVAKERFEQKELQRQAIVVGLDRELGEQQAMMAANGLAGAGGGNISEEQDGTSLGAPFFLRGALIALLLLLVVLLSVFRTAIIKWVPNRESESDQERARKLSLQWKNFLRE